MNDKSQAIFLHEDEHSISHKRNTKELEHWISHLIFIAKEIDYLHKLCKADKRKECYFLEIELDRKKNRNKQLLSTLVKYSKSRDLLNECDDMQCDRLFIHHHEIYRSKYFRFISEYRAVKEKLFNLIT
ncbi:hypothetical protein [Mesonia maritima]|uniref:PH domain-containing protein n=1 Tax=Mesonia maritima TaxID=1793873 RepID=A0ABU1K9I3_9FLAO|nr:hypothetical protein [Mesonia maritima]MDR6302264.1 hypothetical protein [Mesonia maritima]